MIHYVRSIIYITYFPSANETPTLNGLGLADNGTHMMIKIQFAVYSEGLLIYDVIMHH